MTITHANPNLRTPHRYRSAPLVQRGVVREKTPTGALMVEGEDETVYWIAPRNAEEGVTIGDRGEVREYRGRAKGTYTFLPDALALQVMNGLMGQSNQWEANLLRHAIPEATEEEESIEEITPEPELLGVEEPEPETRVEPEPEPISQEEPETAGRVRVLRAWPSIEALIASTRAELHKTGFAVPSPLAQQPMRTIEEAIVADLSERTRYPNGGVLGSIDNPVAEPILAEEMDVDSLDVRVQPLLDLKVQKVARVQNPAALHRYLAAQAELNLALVQLIEPFMKNEGGGTETSG